KLPPPAQPVQPTCALGIARGHPNEPPRVRSRVASREIEGDRRLVLRVLASTYFRRFVRPLLRERVFSLCAWRCAMATNLRPGTLSVLLAATLAAPALGLEYEFVPIEDAPGASGTDPHDVNEFGDVVGLTQAGGLRPFLWQEGVMTILPTLAGGPGGYAEA